MQTNVYAHPSMGTVGRVMELYEIADEASRIATKFHAILDRGDAS